MIRSLRWSLSEVEVLEMTFADGGFESLSHLFRIDFYSLFLLACPRLNEKSTVYFLNEVRDGALEIAAITFAMVSAGPLLQMQIVAFSVQSSAEKGL